MKRQQRLNIEVALRTRMLRDILQRHEIVGIEEGRESVIIHRSILDLVMLEAYLAGKARTSRRLR